jgi:hypothetical protein
VHARRGQLIRSIRDGAPADLARSIFVRVLEFAGAETATICICTRLSDGKRAMISKIMLATALTLAPLLPAATASAEGIPLARETPWPIRNGHNYQPTEAQLKTLHLQDVTPDQARQIDRLYDELLANSDGGRKQKHTSGR